MPDSPSTANLEKRIPFTRYKTFPSLFKTYVTDFESVAAYYQGDFRSVEERRRAAERAAAWKRDRESLSEILRDQNEAWGSDEKVREGIEALRDPETVAVVTGQQVGLLLGPMYTVLKTISVIQLAAQLSNETGRRVVPMFWLEGEDHDFEEVSGIWLLRGNELAEIRYRGEELSKGNRGPVGRLVLSNEIEEVIKQVDDLLPPTDFKEVVMQSIRSAYQPGVTVLDAFARLLRTIFPDSGLIMVNPGDERLKQLSQPLFRRELQEYEETNARLQAVSKKLEGQYHAQVLTRPTNLFLVQENGRYAIEAFNGQFRLRGTQQVFPEEDLQVLIDEHPEKFSPNVVMRPLMQDVLLPTAIYVAGPAEISYFAQFKPMYEWAQVPMPLIYPRASLTVVESKVQKVLDQYGLTPVDFEDDIEKLFRKIVLGGLEADLEGTFNSTLHQIDEAIDTVLPVIERIDQTLLKTVEATRASVSKEIERLKERVVKAEKRRHDSILNQLEKVRVNLFPRGKLQERVISPIYFLNKYSMDFLSSLRSNLSLRTTDHQVLVL